MQSVQERQKQKDRRLRKKKKKNLKKQKGLRERWTKYLKTRISRKNLRNG